MTDTRTMFKELVAANIIGYGGGDGKERTSFSAGVTYGETFAKCYTGVELLSSFDDLRSLYSKWTIAGRTWEGVVAWLAVKIGYLPLYWCVDRYKKHGKFDWDSLNLPENPHNELFRELERKLEQERKNRDSSTPE